MNLKNYQSRAVEKLLDRSFQLLSQGRRTRLVFQAPTGSGKTIMMADLLEKIVLLSPQHSPGISIIWTAPRQLHEQSKLKLSKYYEDSRTLTCSNFYDIEDNRISENEIIFLNWESINRKQSNTIIRKKEGGFYLEKVIENTRNTGRKVILVIDESHHHATSEISKSLIDLMSPDLTVEVSATPTFSEHDEIVKINLDEVKEEGMIKKNVVLNEEFENVFTKKGIVSSLSSRDDQVVLGQALMVRQNLVEGYLDLERNINPLLLIQMPDRRSELEDQIMQMTIDYLAKDHGITTGNGKLAIYLSENKINLDNIAHNDNETQVLIFKQGIALGWDCPRAQILVLFRDHINLTFSVQTVGRIMRMPEPDFGHYPIEILNKAYVFTNIEKIEIHEEMARGYITAFASKRIDEYESIELSSTYTLRNRERTRLSSAFTKIFLRVSEKYCLKDKLKLRDQTVSRSIISSIVAASADEMLNQSFEANIQYSVENESSLQQMFDFFIQNSLHPFFPELRSIGRLKESIYEFFLKDLQMDYVTTQMELIKICLSDDNNQHFINVIDEAKIIYKNQVASRENILVKVMKWEVPEKLNFSVEHEEYPVKKSVMTPFFLLERYKTEISFIDFLERADAVEWWFKNGDRDSTFFAVPYLLEDEQRSFYVDFIVKLKDGRIGLFDTKRGWTLDAAPEKSDGLQKYIQSSTKIFGGITNNTMEDFSGRWMYFNYQGKFLKSGDFENWILVDFI